MKALFQSRTEAGMAVAELLGKYAGLGTVVLGLDRGGTIVAAELAHGLGSPADLLPVQVFGVPCEPHTPLGAVAPDGVCVLDDQAIDRFGVEADALGTLRCQADGELERQSRLLRGERQLARVDGRNVVLVADAIGSTLPVRAAILYLRQHEPQHIAVTAPVMMRAAADELRALVSDLVTITTLDTTPSLNAIYAQPEIPSDADVRRVLGIAEAPVAALSVASADD